MRFFLSEKFRTLFIVVFLLGPVTLCFTASQLPEKIAESDSSESVMRKDALNNSLDSFALFLKTVGIVICFSTMLYLFLRWYRKSVYGKNFNKLSSEMKLLGAINVGQKKSICMVNVLEHVLVLGLTENNMNLLLDIPEEEISQHVKESLLEDKNEPPENFGKILNQWMKKDTA